MKKIGLTLIFTLLVVSLGFAMPPTEDDREVVKFAVDRNLITYAAYKLRYKKLVVVARDGRYYVFTETCAKSNAVIDMEYGYAGYEVVKFVQY